MNDPLHPIKQKLEEIHEDVKGGNKQLNDRMDREVGERAHGVQRIFQAIVDMEHRIVTWWRGKD